MSDFFRYPHTPHLHWLGVESPRDDKILSRSEAANILANEVVVQEKVDGANIGISVDDYGDVRVQNRGQYLHEPYHGQFSRLGPWLDSHRDAIAVRLEKDLILFGEWCAARHTIRYDALPDWFLAFDVYDRGHKKFWSTRRVKDLAANLLISAMPVLKRGHFTEPQLLQLLTTTKSAYGAPMMEGIVVRQEGPDWLNAKAKVVRGEFSQSIEDHWSRRRLEWNRVTGLY
jgi:hypothetical protein